MDWKTVVDYRAECDNCDWEAWSQRVPLNADAKNHKREHPDHTVTIWREQWKEVK